MSHKRIRKCWNLSVSSELPNCTILQLSWTLEISVSRQDLTSGHQKKKVSRRGLGGNISYLIWALIDILLPVGRDLQKTYLLPLRSTYLPCFLSVIVQVFLLYIIHWPLHEMVLLLLQPYSKIEENAGGEGYNLLLVLSISLLFLILKFPVFFCFHFLCVQRGFLKPFFKGKSASNKFFSFPLADWDSSYFPFIHED